MPVRAAVAVVQGAAPMAAQVARAPTTVVVVVEVALATALRHLSAATVALVAQV
jgi:hypothetical protein